MNKRLDTRITLCLLWVVIMLNMIFNDIFSIMLVLEGQDIGGVPGDIKIIMLIAGIVTNIPIFMVLLSYVLNHQLSRKLNIFAGFFTIIYITAGGNLTPHYILVAAIEVILCIVVIVISWKWKTEPQK